jgi:hypothetical protein
VASDPTFTDWLTAVGGVSAAVAAIVLAVLAYRQIVETRKQSSAALEQAQISKDAAARQVFPLVYAHAWKGPQRREGEIAFRYYLTNEGLEPALNVEHGVILGSRTHVFGQEGAFMFRTIQPGECLPPRPVGSTDPIPPEPITRLVESKLVDDPARARRPPSTSPADSSSAAYRGRWPWTSTACCHVGRLIQWKVGTCTAPSGRKRTESQHI